MLTVDEIAALIPDDVVEAAARALCVVDKINPDEPWRHWKTRIWMAQWNAYEEHARAAIAAALNAWPGAEVVEWYHADKTLIPPLPKEPRDE